MLFRKYLFHRIGWSTPIVAVIGGLLLAGSPFIYRAALDGEARDEAEAAAFRTRGVETTGKVIHTQTKMEQQHGGAKGQPHTVTIHVVNYEYRDVAGKVYRASGRVSQERAAGLHHASPIPIAYLNDDPAKSRINYEPPARASNAGRVVAMVFGAVGAGLTILTVVHFVISWRAARKKGRLISTGQLASGTVTDLAIERGKDQAEVSRCLVFEFVHANGSVYTGTSEPLPKRLREQWAVGDSVPVVYDVDDPNVSDVDLFGAR